MSGFIRRAIVGAADAPLSKRQKQLLCRIARTVWEKEGRPYFDAVAWASGSELALSPSEAFELWRHETQERTCGRRHLTCATQRDYPVLMAEYARMLGDTEQAMYWVMRAADDPARQAMAKLKEELKCARGTIARPEEYVSAIARRQYGAEVSELSANQIWSLVFTIRNRVRSKRNA